MASKALAHHENCCKHPAGSFFGNYAGKDVYFFQAPDAGEWQYCCRASSEKSDYRAGAVKHLFNRFFYGEDLSRELIIASANERVALISMFLEYVGFRPASL